MAEALKFEVEVPRSLAGLKLPAGVQSRLKHLLDKQDEGNVLSSEERAEAEGLVDLSELLALLRLRSRRLANIQEPARS